MVKNLFPQNVKLVFVIHSDNKGKAFESDVNE